MTSHIMLPYEWVKCLNQDECRHIVHYHEPADTMNAFPQEWVEKLFGFTVQTVAFTEYIIYRNGDGEQHRVGHPAVERSGGAVSWWVNGKLHREDGPAIEFPDGTWEWYLNGYRHCEGGPAVERVNGYQEWWLEGKRHRDDGPAVIRSDGTQQWYHNNVLVSEAVFLASKKHTELVSMKYDE